MSASAGWQDYNPKEQGWQDYKPARPDFAAHPPGISAPRNPIKTQELENPRSRNFAGELPGSAEGANLAEGLSDWDRASFGEMGGGAFDVAHGQIARGAHRMISGAGAATLPVLPFAAAGAPVPLAKAMVGGTLASKVSSSGAEALGATPDQSDLAGDVGGLAGGYAGVKAPLGKIGRSALIVGKASGKLPVIDKVFAAGRTLGELKDVWKKPPVYPGAPLPASPPEGEFVDSPPTIAKPQPPYAYSEVVGPRALPSAPDQNALPPVAHNVKVPGDIPPLVTRPRAVSPYAPAEPIPPRSGLQLKGEVPEPSPGIAPRALGKKLDTTLGEAVGARPLQPDVPLRNQRGPLPEGHTSVESTAVKSYKYDPSAQELHITDNSGATHVYGEVTPAQADAFRTSPSKGQAWKAIRDNNVRTAKIPAGGSRIASKGASDYKSVGPDTPAPDEDMLPKLRKSLKMARKSKKEAQ